MITFEELQALFDSKDLDIASMEEDVLDNASYYGRIFARSGGVSDAVAQALKEQGLDDFDLKAVPCDGIEACRIAQMCIRDRCNRIGVTITVDDQVFPGITRETFPQFFEEHVMKKLREEGSI